MHAHWNEVDHAEFVTGKQAVEDRGSAEQHRYPLFGTAGCKPQSEWSHNEDDAHKIVHVSVDTGRDHRHGDVSNDRISGLLPVEAPPGLPPPVLMLPGPEAGLRPGDVPLGWSPDAEPTNARGIS